MAEDRLMETVTETITAWAKKFEEKNAEIAALKKQIAELEYELMGLEEEQDYETCWFRERYDTKPLRLKHDFPAPGGEGRGMESMYEEG